VGLQPHEKSIAAAAVSFALPLSQHVRLLHPPWRVFPPRTPRAHGFDRWAAACSETAFGVESDRMMSSKEMLTIFTIGHSTHPIQHFLELLQANAVAQLIDIRTIPKSRHNPQFNTDALAASLRVAHIRYVHMKELGGLRQPRKDSINLGWRNRSFRGFADYMQTEEFEAALDRAIELAAAHPSVLMCAEAVPWRCHRSLVADALVVRGIRVLEIIGLAKPKEHALTPFARVNGTQITYPGNQSSLMEPA
jgi:hypothetical protein